MKLILLLSAFAFASPAVACDHPDKPADVKLVCSAVWNFQGNCDGTEQVFAWEIVSGPTKAPAGEPFIRPFEDFPIIVVGYEMMRLDNNKEERNNWGSWFMIGSAMTGQPDSMLWLPPGERHAKQIWPEGLGQFWPAKSKANPGRLTDMVDLHGSCWGGGQVNILVTIYYRKAATMRIRTQ